MGSYDWQKAALTNSDGTTISVSDLDFDNPTQITKSGFIICTTLQMVR